MESVPALACTALLLSALAPVASHVGPAPAQADEFTRIVASTGKDQETRLDKLAVELARLPNALDAFFGIASSGAVSGFDGRPQALTEVQVELLAQAAECFERRAVTTYVRERLTEEADDAWRRTALRLLARHGTPDEFSLLARLVVLDRVTQAVRENLLPRFQEAVVAILRRHGLELRDLDWLANEAEPLREILIRGVGSCGDPEGLRWLAPYLEDPEYGAAALQEIGRLAPAAGPELAGEAARGIHPLLRSAHPSTRKQAVSALGALRDPASIPFLVALLEQGLTSAERKMAHGALRQISAVDLPAQAEAWTRWYAEEKRWLQEEGPAWLDRLGSDDDARVVSAIKSLSEHPLHRDRIATELSPLLSTHPSATVRGQVCLGLARLEAKPALPHLVEALEDDDPTVRRQAHVALGAITGLRLPPDRTAWDAVLDPGR